MGLKLEAFNNHMFPLHFAYRSLLISMIDLLWLAGRWSCICMARVYVGNLDDRVSARDLEDEFRVFGVLRR
jgi:hypothetical protein